jgi:hypothetical protein
MSRYGPSFIATNTRRLARRGLRGDTITVVLAGDVVGLIGAEGGDEPIPLGRIAGLRAGRLHGRENDALPELLLFLHGEAAPLRLRPSHDPADAAAALRSDPDFVRSVVAALGTAARIETGAGLVWAALSTALLALPAGGMLVVFATTVASDLPGVARWIAPVFTGIFALGLSWLCWWWWRETWPRAVRNPSDLERMLRSR